MSWREFYETDAQGLWSLIVVPAVFLLWRALAPVRRAGIEPATARFVHAWSIVFALETVLDPLVTGPLVRWLGVADGLVGQLVLFLFVYLGDFRMFVLLLGVATPGRSLARVVAEAAAWSLVVPGVTFAAMTALRALLGSLPGTVLWLVYEIAFTALALVLRQTLVPARVSPERPAVRAYLRAVLAYVAVYYALWGAADALILLGVDAGWAIRIVPNQLYYSFFVPFAALR